MKELKSEILQKVSLHAINTDDVLVSSIRHLEALQKTQESLNRVLENIDTPVTSDFLTWILNKPYRCTNKRNLEFAKKGNRPLQI